MKLGIGVTFETLNGNVAVVTDSAVPKITIIYPQGSRLDDDTLAETLKMQKAFEIYDRYAGTRKFGDFFSDRLEDGGRVWVKAESCTEDESYNLISYNGVNNIKAVDNEMEKLETCKSFYISDKESNVPNGDRKYIEQYLPNLIKAALVIAKSIGEITGINVQFEKNVFGTLYDFFERYDPAVDFQCNTNEKYNSIYVYDQKDEIGIAIYCYTKEMPYNTLLRKAVDNSVTFQDVCTLIEKYNK